MLETSIPAEPALNSLPLRGRIEIVSPFTPNWFTITMGTEFGRDGCSKPGSDAPKMAAFGSP